MFIIPAAIGWGAASAALPILVPTMTAAAIGTAALTIGAIAGSAVYMSSEQKKAQTKATKSAEQAAALQEAKMKDLAGQQYQITQQQMKLQQGQRQIQGLSDALEKTSTSPRIFTLPSEQKKFSFVDAVNAQIDAFLKAA
jgi:uncharacterized protein HemX